MKKGSNGGKDWQVKIQIHCAAMQAVLLICQSTSKVGVEASSGWVPYLFSNKKKENLTSGDFEILVAVVLRLPRTSTATCSNKHVMGSEVYCTSIPPGQKCVCLRQCWAFGRLLL